MLGLQMLKGILYYFRPTATVIAVGPGVRTRQTAQHPTWASGVLLLVFPIIYRNRKRKTNYRIS